MLALTTKIRAAVAALSDVVVPPRCLACGGAVGPAADWCDACAADLRTPERAVCRRCATPLPQASTPTTAGADDCPVCREVSWAFDGVVALGVYTGVLRELLLEAKRPAGAVAAVGVGRLLAAAWRADPRSQPDCRVVITPMPMHWRRRWSRGSNSAESLAEGLAAELRAPLRSLLRRRRATRPQTSVAPSTRPQNVRGAFAARGRLSGETVLLVDDVLTTGSSCSAAARQLKRAGAGRVIAVVAARRVAPA
ncbi:MAG: double zinc ribbon domain-containing protein [Planctomycetota bacterium]